MNDVKRVIFLRHEISDLLQGIVGLQQYVHNYKLPNRIILGAEYKYRVRALEELGYPNIAKKFREYLRE